MSKFKVGSVWIMRNGTKVQIVENRCCGLDGREMDFDYPIDGRACISGEIFTFTANGEHNAETLESPYDLVSLHRETQTPSLEDKIINRVKQGLSMNIRTDYCKCDQDKVTVELSFEGKTICEDYFYIFTGRG